MQVFLLKKSSNFLIFCSILNLYTPQILKIETFFAKHNFIAFFLLFQLTIALINKTLELKYKK